MLSKSSESSVELQGPSSCEETAFTGRYRFLWPIGRGGCAQVLLAYHLLTGAEVAVKVLPKAGRELQVLSEQNVMRALEHPNVIQLFQVIETREHVYVVMELAGGESLFHHIKPGGMQEEEARRLFQQVACAVGYCHKKGIVHRDLKSENILVDAGGNVKLIDFGISVRMSDGKKLSGFQGTVPYFAPEIVIQKEYEGPPVDVWGLGILLFFMLTGTFPFMANSLEQLVPLIRKGRYRFPSHVSTNARNLIRKMLTVDPKARPTVEQILQHRWLCKGKNAARHSGEPLPKCPDPAIMTVLLDMGYNPYKTWESLTQRRFDDAMAVYLILRHQRSQGVDCTVQVKPTCQPRPTVVSECPALPKSARAPALHTFPSSSEGQRPEQARHKVIRRFSAPNLALQCPNHWRLLSGPTRATEGSNSSHDSRDNHKVWKRVTGRIAACFQHLCCWAPCADRVAPMQVQRKRSRFPNRVAPM